MMQIIEAPQSIAVMSAPPTLPGDGVDLGDEDNFRHAKYLLTITLSAGTSLEILLYGLINGVWGRLCDPGNTHGILGATALDSPGVYHFEVEHVGVATRFALAKGTDTGTVTASATIARVRERTR